MIKNKFYCSIQEKIALSSVFFFLLLFQVNLFSYTNIKENVPLNTTGINDISTPLIQNINNNGNTISGVKYNDRNANGIQDIGDSYLRIWTIDLIDVSTGQVVATRTTDRYGKYSFVQIGIGTYTVNERFQVGWIQTAPGINNIPVFTFTDGVCRNETVDFGNHFEADIFPLTNTCSDIDSGCATTEVNITTGVDHSTNSFFAGGVPDTYWQFINVPTGSYASVGDQATVITSPVYGWHNNGIPNSLMGRWIGPHSTYNDSSSANTSCSYTYQRYFSTCEDGEILLDFTIFADNTIEELRVDGKVIGSFLYYIKHFLHGVAVNANLTVEAGRHCIEIDINNIGGPTGFKLEGSIFGNSLIDEDCSILGSCDAIIPLRSDMFRNNLAGGLVNEQGLIGDPLNGIFGNPAAPWHNACWPSPCPAEVDTLDLDEEHDLCGIYLYYSSGTASFEIDYWDATNSSWVNVFNAPLTQDQYVQINATTQSLRFTNNRHADVNEIVLYGTPTYLRNSHKIPLTTSMISNNNNQGVPSNLVDEQAIAGSPIHGTGGSPTTAWAYSCWAACTPIHEVLDLGRQYNINALAFHDGNGAARFTIEYDDNNSWVPLFDGLLNQAQVWRIVGSLNIHTSKLRFTNYENQSQVNEILLYGRVSLACPPTGNNNLAAPIEIDDEIVNTSNTLRIFPNPSYDQVEIVFPTFKDKNTLVQLFSVTGEKVKELTLKANTNYLTFSLINLPSGTYYLYFMSEDGPIIEKILKI